MTEKGQVTIPKPMRDALGIDPGTEVEFEQTADAIVVRKAPKQPSRGRRLVQGMRGRADLPMSTAEIMALTRGG